MINTLDNFLDKETYDSTYQKLLDNDFIEISLEIRFSCSE
jgi:hypothetical protein